MCILCLVGWFCCSFATPAFDGKKNTWFRLRCSLKPVFVGTQGSLWSLFLIKGMPSDEERQGREPPAMSLEKQLQKVDT